MMHVVAAARFILGGGGCHVPMFGKLARLRVMVPNAMGPTLVIRGFLPVVIKAFTSLTVRAFNSSKSLVLMVGMGEWGPIAWLSTQHLCFLTQLRGPILVWDRGRFIHKLFRLTRLGRRGLLLQV